MNEDRASSGGGRLSGIALLACVAVGIFIGIMCGLSLARRLAPPPTEARLIMQLLAVEQDILSTRAKAGLCESTSPEREKALLALTDLVSPSLRDTLLVDAAFERKVQRLRQAVEGLATSTARDCETRVRLLAAIDSACRDCHLDYRAGESR